MCDPATASLGIAAASSVVSFAGQKTQADAQNRIYLQNVATSRANAVTTENSLSVRQLQEGQATSAQLTALNLEEAQREAGAQVSGEQMGIAGGVNLGNLVAGIGAGMERSRLALTQNYNMKVLQFQQEKESANPTELSRINAVPIGNEPSPLDPLLKTAGAGLRYFADQERQNRLTGDPTSDSFVLGR